MALGLCLSWWAWQQRHDFENLLSPLFLQQEEVASIRTDTLGYRPFSVEAPLRWGWGMHISEAIVPSATAVFLGFGLVVLGWAALLTAATRMRGVLPYLIYFTWTAWVFMAEAAQTWAGTDPFYLVSLALALLVLVPVYLIQTGLWQQPLYGVFILASLLISLLALGPSLWKDAHTLYYLQPWVAFPSILLLLAVILGALHGPLIVGAVWAYLQERLVWGKILFVGGTFVLLALSSLLFLLHQEAAYDLAMILGVGMLLIGFFFVQPYYPSLSGLFAQPMGLLWAWAGMALIVSGGLFYHGRIHEYMVLYRAAEVMRAAFGVGLPLVILYMGLNFWPLWQARKGFYWDLTKSPRIGLAVYYFGLIALLSFFEARNDWPTATLSFRLYAPVRADRALLIGQIEEARLWYQQAAFAVPLEAKVNYNLARIEAQSLKDVERSTDYYEKAFNLRPFLPAALQASLIWLAGDRPVAAIQSLQRYLTYAPPAAPAYNMLGYAFYRAGFLDSAAYYWKEAVRLAPREPLYHLNLALLYARHGKPAWTQTILRSLPPLKDPPEGLCDNLIYLQLLGYSVLPSSLACISSNARWVGQAEDTSQVAELLRSLRRGDLRLGESLAKYLAEQDPGLRLAIMRLLGMAFLQRGHARRAAEIFLSAQTPQDSLYAAYALGEAGCLEAAFQLSTRIGALYRDLELPSRQEAALLIAAAGRLAEVSFYHPLEKWETSDYLRFSQLVMHTKNLNEAVVILRPFVDKGIKVDKPYEAVARLFLAYRDTAAAIENLRAGLERLPTSVGLRLLWAEIVEEQGRRDTALILLKAAQSHLWSRSDSSAWWESRLRYAKRYEALPQQREAAEEALKAFPTMSLGQALMAEVELAAGQTEAAHHRLSEALDMDPHAEALWRVYERVAVALGLQEEAKAARQKPDPCPSAL
jgi:tetratricopeptide (TPR) repeat protein